MLVSFKFVGLSMFLLFNFWMCSEGFVGVGYHWPVCRMQQISTRDLKKPTYWPFKKGPLVSQKPKQNDRRDEMIDEKSFSCPPFAILFCFSGIFWDVVFCQHDSTCWNCWNSLMIWSYKGNLPYIFTTFFCSLPIATTCFFGNPWFTRDF